MDLWLNSWEFSSSGNEVLKINERKTGRGKIKKAAETTKFYKL